MNESLTKEEIEAARALEGEARGVTLLTDARHIVALGGQEGIARVQRELARVGCPLDYGAIKPLEWYPLSWRVLSLLVMKSVFDLKASELRDAAASAPKRSFIIRLMASFFVSPEAIVARFPELWEKHYTVGTLGVDELDLEGGELLISIHDAMWHPLQCRYQEGYIYRVLSLIFPGKPIRVEEVKCMYRGDPYHQYLGKWED